MYQCKAKNKGFWKPHLDSDSVQEEAGEGEEEKTTGTVIGTEIVTQKN